MKNRKILAVDDEPDLRATLADLLRGDGYTVIEASGGVEGLEALAAERPALMLLDLRMPGLDGLEVLKQARLLDKAVPIIMLTSERDLGVAQRILELGATEYVTKPFDAEYLRAEVTRLIDDGPK